MFYHYYLNDTVNQDLLHKLDNCGITVGMCATATPIVKDMHRNNLHATVLMGPDQPQEGIPGEVLFQTHRLDKVIELEPGRYIIRMCRNRFGAIEPMQQIEDLRKIDVVLISEYPGHTDVDRRFLSELVTRGQINIPTEVHTSGWPFTAAPDWSKAYRVVLTPRAFLEQSRNYPDDPNHPLHNAHSVWVIEEGNPSRFRQIRNPALKENRMFYHYYLSDSTDDTILQKLQKQGIAIGTYTTTARLEKERWKLYNRSLLIGPDKEFSLVPPSILALLDQVDCLKYSSDDRLVVIEGKKSRFCEPDSKVENPESDSSSSPLPKFGIAHQFDLVVREDTYQNAELLGELGVSAKYHLTPTEFQTLLNDPLTDWSGILSILIHNGERVYPAKLFHIFKRVASFGPDLGVREHTGDFLLQSLGKNLEELSVQFRKEGLLVSSTANRHGLTITETVLADKAAPNLYPEETQTMDHFDYVVNYGTLADAQLLEKLGLSAEHLLSHVDLIRMLRAPSEQPKPRTLLIRASTQFFSAKLFDLFESISVYDEGGVAHYRKQDVFRQKDPDNPNTVVGFFAHSNVKEGERLMAPHDQPEIDMSSYTDETKYPGYPGMTMESVPEPQQSRLRQSFWDLGNRLNQMVNFQEGVPQTLVECAQLHRKTLDYLNYLHGSCGSLFTPQDRQLLSQMYEYGLTFLTKLRQQLCVQEYSIQNPVCPPSAPHQRDTLGEETFSALQRVHLLLSSVDLNDPLEQNRALRQVEELTNAWRQRLYPRPTNSQYSMGARQVTPADKIQQLESRVAELQLRVKTLEQENFHRLMKANHPGYPYPGCGQPQQFRQPQPFGYAGARQEVSQPFGYGTTQQNFQQPNPDTLGQLNQMFARPHDFRSWPAQETPRDMPNPRCYNWEEGQKIFKSMLENKQATSTKEDNQDKDAPAPEESLGRILAPYRKVAPVQCDAATNESTGDQKPASYDQLKEPEQAQPDSSAEDKPEND